MDTKVRLGAEAEENSEGKTKLTRRTRKHRHEVAVVENKQKQVPAAQGKKSIQTLH